METHETYVSLEVAKLLKQAGFDWECKHVYKNDIAENKNVFEYTKGYWKNHKDILLSAPTLSVAQRWLRERKGYEVIVGLGINENDCPMYICEVINIRNHINLDAYLLKFNTYDEALEAGIKKCLEMILKNCKK